MEPVQFILRQGHETLTPLAGLALAGKAIAKAEAFLPVVDESLLHLVKRSKVPITPLSCGWVVLDMDVFPLYHSDTRKEGIGWTQSITRYDATRR